MSRPDLTYAERHAAPRGHTHLAGRSSVSFDTDTMLTRWVCGEHTEQSVRPSGKGCPLCAKARTDRSAKRTAKKNERRQKDADRARVGQS